MKILFQSDDYGISRAQAQGCLFAIQNGIIKNTGFFSNMEWAEEVFEWIKPYLNDIAFGIDLNASTGPSVLTHEQIPVLTHEDGTFLGSRENRALDTDENNHDHLAAYKDQLYAEFEAQIQKFIKVVGKKPDYIHNHAYGTKTTEQVTHELAMKYGCISTASLIKRNEVAYNGMGWYAYGGDISQQLNEDLASYLIEDEGNMLSSNKEYGYVICHTGYVDIPIFEMSSFNICRAKDLEAMTSKEVKEWITNNNIESITFNDLPREWIEK